MSLVLTPSFPSVPGLSEQLLAFRRRWRIVAVCMVGLPLVTFVTLKRVPVTYTATGILIYDPEHAAVPGDTATSPLADAANQDSITASQSAVIASLPAATAMAAKLDLMNNPAFNAALRPAHWPFRPGKAPRAADLADDVRHDLAVTVLPGSRVLSVSFTAGEPALAAAAVNLAMQLYLAHERDESFAALTDAQAWLEQHAAQVQQELNDTETALAAARAAAGVVQGAQASLTTETASRLAASLVEAQADLAMNQARLASAANGDAAAANAAIAPNLLPLRKEQADLQAQVQSLSITYGPDYPALRTASTQLTAITAEIEAETARELDAARAEVSADQAQIATLQSALANARTESETEDEESAPTRALEQRAAAARDMLRSMTVQAGELAQAASLTKPDARILSAAAIPTVPSSAHNSLILAASLALGFFAGVLAAALAEALDTSFRSGALLRAVTGLPCLAMIPRTRAPVTHAILSPFSLYAEQLRALRTALGVEGRVIAVTAARPAEGKTTLTVAFARSLAAAGLRVLAIDGDIRQPSFDALFRTGGQPGLTDCLTGLAKPADCVVRDRLTTLDILPAGTQAKSALSLFLSPALPDMFRALRPDYNVILVDVPPAFALAEGRVLARLADCAILCVRWASTPRRVVLAAMVALREAGVELAGAVITRVDAKAHGRSGFADAEIYQPRFGGYFRK